MTHLYLQFISVCVLLPVLLNSKGFSSRRQPAARRQVNTTPPVHPATLPSSHYCAVIRGSLCYLDNVWPFSRPVSAQLRGGRDRN